MIDYTHIPTHIRCTQRHKIDENYPASDARWWELQEKRAKVSTAPTRAIYAEIPTNVLEWYDAQKAEPEVGLSIRIASALGIPVRHFYSAMKNYRRGGREARQAPAKPIEFMTPLEVSLDPYLRSEA